MGEGRNGELFKKYKVSILQDRNVLEICCTTIQIYLTLLNCTLTYMVKMVVFLLCCLPQSIFLIIKKVRGMHKIT